MTLYYRQIMQYYHFFPKKNSCLRITTSLFCSIRAYLAERSSYLQSAFSLIILQARNIQLRFRNRSALKICLKLFLLSIKYSQFIQMKSGSKQDKKSTQGSTGQLRIDTENSQDQIFERKSFVYSPRASSKNLNNALTGFRTPKKMTEFSVSPRRPLPSENQQQSDREHSIGPSNGSTVHDEAVSRYQCIASLTEQQNRNLRQQNKYLIEKMRKMQEKETKVRKLYEKAKKYKMLYQEALMEMAVLKDECQIYKDQAEQMKKIILNDVYKLKQKVIESEINDLNINQEYYETTDNSKRSQASTENKSARISSNSSLSKYFRVEEI